MSRRCGSSKPIPTPLNGLAMKSGKTRTKVIEGKADTVIMQPNVKNPPAYHQRGGGARQKRRYDTANDRQNPPANRQRGGWGRDEEMQIEGERRRYDKGNQRQNPPAGRHRGGGARRKAKANTKMERWRNPQSREGGKHLAENV